MSVNVESLGKLERRITLTLAASEIGNEVKSRLQRLARTVKADGFRPGKVPMSVVTQRFGYSVQYEVINDRVGKAFSDAAGQAQLRVAGTPQIAQKDEAPEGQLAFDATFEVYPEVRVGDLSARQIERVSTEVTDAAIDRTVEILRRQRRTFNQRPAAEGAAETDRVTIDFEGKIDGEPFAGGKADAFQFIIGEGQMLAQFDQAVRGMKVGESKTFPLQFPADYQGQEVAGKEADFLVTMKKVEAALLPPVDEDFVRSLGIKDATVEALRADVRRNLEREVKFRVSARNKAAVMDALLQVAELDLPKALVDAERQRLVDSARADLKQRGVKDAESVPIPEEAFQPQAERRVRLGLVVSEIVRDHQLQARPDQLQKHIEEISQSYERPADVMRYYLGDRQRMAEVEALVVESNVTEFVLSRAQVADKALPFDELMAAA
jgi:trigger factor